MTDADEESEHAIVSYIVERWLGPVARTNVWCSVVMAISLGYLGIPWWKAAVVGVVVLLCMVMSFGRKTFSRVSFIALLIAILAWLDWIPAMERWRAALESLLSHIL